MVFGPEVAPGVQGRPQQGALGVLLGVPSCPAHDPWPLGVVGVAGVAEPVGAAAKPRGSRSPSGGMGWPPGVQPETSFVGQTAVVAVDATTLGSFGPDPWAVGWVGPFEPVKVNYSTLENLIAVMIE